MNQNADDQKLLQLFWEINGLFFGGILPPIEIRFSTRLRTTGGCYFARPKKEIRINARYLKADDGWKSIRDTLGHEMVHFWLDYLGRPCGHNPEFRKKIRECGFSRYSTLAPIGRRFLYACHACGREYYRKRRGILSCGPCSGQKFNPLFTLRLMKDIVSY